MGYFWSLLDTHASKDFALYERFDGLDAGKTPKKHGEPLILAP
jgi:hypothetical protein